MGSGYFTYKFFNMSDYAHKTALLLFDTLSKQVNLVKVGVHGIAAYITVFLLFLMQFLLRFTGSCRQQVRRYFP